MVAAAILGAGAVGAGASIWGANTAAGAQTKATNAAITNQRQMFDISQNALSPFINAGQGGISSLTNLLNPDNASGPLAALLKLTMPGSNMTDTLKETPGYQFAEDRGLRATNNALAARGLGGSGGAVAKGAADYTTGLASQTWQSVVNALQGLFTSNVGGAQGLVSTGVGAGGALAGNALNTGANIGSSLIGQGNAQAGAATATGNAISGAANNIPSNLLLSQLLAKSPAGGGGGGGLYGNGAVPYTAGSNAWGA